MSIHAAVRQFRAGQLWRADGWHADAALAVDADGRLRKPDDRADGEMLGAWVLPGMPNLHSHAFQRAMAGLAERKGRADDSFWSWRETMYAFAATVGPDELQAIAAQLYVEMLKAGYTHVCEFHYLHHQPDGTPYARPEAMSLALVEAAREAGADVREGVRVTGVRWRRGRAAGVVYEDADGAVCEIDAPLVVGADGRRSLVAREANVTTPYRRHPNGRA